MLGERILELEKDKERPVQGRTQQSNRSTPKHGTSTREQTQAPNEKNATPSPTHQKNLNGQYSYAAVAAAQPTQIPN